MQLVILGSSVANAIKKAIEPKVDNITITTYASMNDFANETELRSVLCDRLILTEEAVTGSDMANKRQHLLSFKDFLYSRYTDITVITINKEKSTLDLCADVFCDENNINIWITGKVKPACMVALADSSVDELESMFGENTARGILQQETMRKEAEIREAQNDPTFAVSSEFSPAPVEEEPQKKKKGLFGMFGGKQKANTPPQSAPSPTPSTPEVATTPQAVRRRKPSGFGGNNAEPVVEAPSVPANNFDDGFNEFDFDSDVVSPNVNDDTQFFEDASDFNADLTSIDDSFSSGGTDDSFSSDDSFDTDLTNGGNTYESESGMGTADFNDTSDFNNAYDNTADFDSVNDNYVDNDTPDFGSELADNVIEDFEPDINSNGSEVMDNMDSPSFDMEFDDFGDLDVTNNEPQNNGSSADTYMGPSNAQQRAPVQRQNLVRRDTGESLRTNDAQMGMDMDFSAIQSYEDARRPVKVVEKEVIKEVVREVRVPSNVNIQQVGGASKYQNILNGVVNQIFVVTGDRRSGITKTALTLATKFSAKVPTLYVDLDLERHGSLYYLGVTELADSETSVQNGLGLIKSGRDIKRYAFRSKNFNFDSLVSMPGMDIPDDTIREAMSQLIYQSKMYNVIIIDCPVEKLYLMEEMMYSADFVVCVASDICSCSNTLFAFDGLQVSKAPVGKGVNDKALSMLYNRSKYLVRVTEEKNEVIPNMQYLEQVYALADDRFNWAKLNYYQGTMENIDIMLQGLI